MLLESKRKSEKGFTLIELIMVIVILGIIAGVAIPKFLSLSTSAKTSAARGVGGALSGTIMALHSNYLLESAAYNAQKIIDGTQYGGGITSSNLSVSGNEITLDYKGTNYTWDYAPASGDAAATITETGNW